MQTREKAAPNYLFEDELSSVDIDTQTLIGLEEWKQTGKLILIPSESIAPKAVRQALGSVFTNVYAEGLPELRVSCKEIKEVQGARCQCVHQRRYGDKRYYQGCEYVNVVEGMAQRRAAGLFATPDVPADDIYANVQPLSGAAANNAVYEALLKPGDTVMGLELTHGGHLTHGSPYNRSGKDYNVVSYGVSERTGRLDYDEIARTAARVQPRMIVAGASAYPWDIDWRRLREIADSLSKRAYLMADISHPAGLVVAGLFPNPVGLADAVTFTTHKTMIGPRAAVILTTDREIAGRVNRAVFPGEQGGPHINAIAAMAVAFKIAESDKFRD